MLGHPGTPGAIRCTGPASLVVSASERTTQGGHSRLRGLLDAGDPYSEAREAQHTKQTVRASTPSPTTTPQQRPSSNQLRLTGPQPSRRDQPSGPHPRNAGRPRHRTSTQPASPTHPQKPRTTPVKRVKRAAFGFRNFANLPDPGAAAPRQTRPPVTAGHPHPGLKHTRHPHRPLQTSQPSQATKQQHRGTRPHDLARPQRRPAVLRGGSDAQHPDMRVPPGSQPWVPRTPTRTIGLSADLDPDHIREEPQNPPSIPPTITARILHKITLHHTTTSKQHCNPQTAYTNTTPNPNKPTPNH